MRRTIDANLALLDRLPADHPNRATLEAHNGELLDLLVRRQQRRFGPFTQAGVSFGVLAGVTIVALILACGPEPVAWRGSWRAPNGRRYRVEACQGHRPPPW